MNRVVFVSGGGRGVGRSCALAFAAQADRVAVVARTRSEVDETAEACRQAGAADALGIVCDATQVKSIDEALREVNTTWGTVDILVHATGGSKTAAFVKTDDALWREMVEVNLTSAFLTARAVLPGMIAKKKGRLLFVGSTASRSGFRYCAAYAAAKHGLLGMVRSLALEVAELDITANLLAPGFLDVPATHAAAAAVAKRTGRSLEQVLTQYRSFSPSGRLVNPDDVADLAVRLASDESQNVNGECVEIEGI